MEQFPEKTDISNEKEKIERYLADYRKYKKSLIKAASLTREHAVSHREPPFKVGCALMTKDGETKDLDGEYGVYTAHNFKPFPGQAKGNEKRCAERNALDVALKCKLETIVAIVTISREISTGDETKARNTLHPCRDCRDMLRKLRNKGILKGWSIICNVNDATGSIEKLAEEERTADELLALYEDDLKE